MANPLQVTPADMLDLQRQHIAGAQSQLGARQRRLARLALADLDRALGKIYPGSWSDAAQRSSMVMLGQALRRLNGAQISDLGIGLSEVTKLSAKDAAKYLTTMDKHYLGSVRPLRFDTAAWWEGTDKRIGQARMRRYSRSFQRYGAGTVAAIEDELGKRILVGQSWADAREKVWEATRDVVGDRRWMVDRIVTTEVSSAYNGTTLAALYEEDEPDDPMLKRLVATFDQSTGMDSHFVHGQTKRLNEQFMDDQGRSYDAPPNRPHDREIVVGWRTSYGEDMPDYVQDTATVRDAAPGVKEWDPGPDMDKATPAPPEPVTIPMQPAARLSQLEHQRLQLRALKAATGQEITSIMKTRIPEGLLRPIEQTAESVSVAQAHNAAVMARVDALRAEIREIQVAQARVDLEVRRAKKAARMKKAVGVDATPARLPKPKPIATLEGAAAKPKPVPKAVLEERVGDEIKAGNYLDLAGTPLRVAEVRTRGAWSTYRLELRKDVYYELEVPTRMKWKTWDKAPDVDLGDELDQLFGLSKAGKAIRDLAGRASKDLADDPQLLRALGQNVTTMSRNFDDSLSLAVGALDEAKLAKRTLQLPGDAPKVTLDRKGSLPAQLKRYVEKKGIADEAKLTGFADHELAEIYVREVDALRDGLEFGRTKLTRMAATAKKRSRAAAWVQWRERAIGPDAGPRNVQLHVNLAYSKSWKQIIAGQKMNRAAGGVPFSQSLHLADDALKYRQTIRHEYGHVVDVGLRVKAVGNDDDSSLAAAILSLWKRRAQALKREDWFQLSAYSSTTVDEGLAEAFAAGYTGLWDKVPESLHLPIRMMLLRRR